MKKVLFIIPAYYTERPQAVRFKNILPFLKNDFDIHLLFPSLTNILSTKHQDGIIVHEYKGSKLGHYINRYYYPKIYSIDNKFNQQLINVLRFLFRSFLFPDLFILEIFKLKRAIQYLNEKNNFDTIIVSCAPFTLLTLGPYIKYKLKVKFVVDIGDPYYKNNVNKYPIQKLLAYVFEKKYLKYVDIFIVTNKATLLHYKKTFNKSISTEKIFLIPHGTKANINQALKSRISSFDKITISYVGIFYKCLREPFELYKAIATYNKSALTRKIYLNIYGSTPVYFKKLPNIECKDYIKFNNPVDHESIYHIYNSSDLVLLIDNAYGLQTPGKLFELISSNKLIFTLYSNPQSTVVELLTKYNGAILIENKQDKIISAFKSLENRESFSIVNNFDIKPYLWESIALGFRKVIN